jgi:hypothetical protein
MTEILILVDSIAMDSYKGAIDELKRGFINLGFTLDRKFALMVFRGPLEILKIFNESKMEYFDENQALGRMFLFISADRPFEELKKKTFQFPIFNLGNWEIYNVLANILLVYRNRIPIFAFNELDRFGTKIFSYSYLLRSDLLDQVYDFTTKEGEIFSCYLVGGQVSIDIWKSSFYNLAI